MAPSPYLEDRRWAMFLPRGLLRPLGTPPVTPGTQNLYLFARKQRLLSELFFYIIIKPKLPLQLNGRLYDHIGKSWSLFSTKPGKVQSWQISSKVSFRKKTWRSLNVNPCFSLNSYFFLNPYCFQIESFYPQRRKKTRAFCKMLISSEKAEWWSCVFPKKFKSRRALILLKQIRYKSL